MGEGFRHAHLDATHFIRAFSPYLFGLQVQPMLPQDAFFWGGVGGYAGLGLTATALMGLWGRPHRTLRWALAAWAVIAGGSLYGAPIITPLVTSVPGVGTAAFFRYLPPSIDFALAVLSGLALQDLAAGTRVRAARPYWAGLGIMAIILAVGVVLAQQHFAFPDKPRSFLPSVGLAVFGALTLIVMGIVPATGRLRGQVVGAVISAEAILLLMVPTFSFPRKGHLELGGVHFLQQNLGLQRFFTMGAIQPNYGSYFGIASINHNDLPVPQAWVDHVMSRLDDNSLKEVFDGLDRQNRDGPTAMDNLLRNIDAYQDVGVRYVVTFPDNPFDWFPSGQKNVNGGNIPIALGDGDQAIITVPNPGLSDVVDSVKLLIATYGGKSDGTMTLTACADDACAAGQASLDTAGDNRFLAFQLDHPLPSVQHDLVITVRKMGGSNPVALWGWPTPSDSGYTLRVNDAPVPGRQVKVALSTHDGAAFKRVYTDTIMSIYELPNPAPYFSAPGCTLGPQSRDVVVANCPAPAPLRRRELFLRGWTATVDGQARPVVPDAPLFQRVDLPAGRSEIMFRFLPPYMGWGYAAFAAGLALTLVGAWLDHRRRGWPRWSASRDTLTAVSDPR